MTPEMDLHTYQMLKEKLYEFEEELCKKYNISNQMQITGELKAIIMERKNDRT